MKTSLKSQLENMGNIESRNAALNQLMPAIDEALATGFKHKEVLDLLAKHSIVINPKTFQNHLYAFRKGKDGSSPKKEIKKLEKKEEEIEPNKKPENLKEILDPKFREKYAEQFYEKKSLFKRKDQK
ncbi:hypothetical protein [Zymomonas mobilis]|uniref:hypothetical protein n=1 Tax=Zymomonas mobilis TaxID=542 RepID=UPI0039E8E689